MLNIRGLTLFPSSIEDVVRGIPTLGPEFATVLTKECNLDALVVQVEREVRSSCELRAAIEVLPQGTLPPTQFKAKRVRDLR
jgi:phenylacetate-CoA ligase